MKKTFKRAGVAVLSMAMLLSMGAVGLTANAAAGDSLKVTIAAPKDAAGTDVASTFTVYQVAKVDGTGTWQWNAPFTGTIPSTTSTATELNTLATSLADIAADSVNATAVGKLTVGNGNNGTQITIVDNAATDGAKVAGTGYYLVVTAPSAASDVVIQPSLIQIDSTGDEETTVAIKATDIPLSKTITSFDNDASGNATGSVGKDGKTGAALPGAVVNYKIATQLPTYNSDANVGPVVGADDIEDFTIFDNPDATITINTDDFSGKANGADVIVTLKKSGQADVVIYDLKDDAEGTDTIVSAAGENVSVAKSVAGDGNNETTNIANKQVAGDTDGFKVTIPGPVVYSYQGWNVEVTFKATVAAAATSTAANNNDVLVQYGNNFSTGGGSGAKADEVPLYAGKIDLEKFGDDAPTTRLAGATFDVKDSSNTIVKTGVTSKADGTVDLGFLDAGTYTLVETAAPHGYKTVGNYTFTISGKDTNNVYSSYTVTPGTDVTDGAVTRVTMTQTGNTSTIKVVEPLADSLPGTGGIGTTLFTVGGAAVVLVAGFMFVMYMKKRGTEEE